MSAPGLGRAFVIGVPFAVAFAISELMRVVNAVAAPALVADVGLDAVGLGLVTGAFFLGFAVAQLPAGILLDRYGPRPVLALLLVLAAAGTAAIGFASDAGLLAAARFTAGVGFSVALMGGFKAFAIGLPAPWLPLANAFLLAAGQVRSLIGTTPAERLVALVGWRAPFMGLALAIVGAAVLVAWLVPPRRGPAGVPLGRLVRELGGVVSSAAFWRIAPLSMTTTAAVLATPALWAGGWLRDVAGLGTSAGYHLAAIALGMAVGYVALGWLAVRPRLGLGLHGLTVVSSLAFLAVQLAIIVAGRWAPLALWTLFGLLGTCGAYGYAMLTRSFGAGLAGRALTAVNLGVVVAAFAIQYGPGWILAQWPSHDGGYPEAAYQVAFGAVLAVQAAAFAWFVRGARPAQRSPSA